MMSDNSRRRTASRLHAYIGAVIVGGIAAIISTFFLQSQEHWGPKPSGFVFLAVLLLVSETQPMRFVRLHEGSDITISWTFAFALVLLTPVGALVVMAVASILGDLLRRKPLIRLAFNAGQMVCSLAVAALVLLLPHGFDLLETSHPSPIWFLVVGLAAICAFVTNIVLTTTVLAIHEGISPRPMMRRAVHSNLSTDGMLLAEVQGDPLLREYDTVIIDEAHERSLNIDFLLGHLRALRFKRPDLKIVITSATIDTAAFSAASLPACHGVNGSTSSQCGPASSVHSRRKASPPGSFMRCSGGRVSRGEAARTASSACTRTVSERPSADSEKLARGSGSSVS